MTEIKDNIQALIGNTPTVFLKNLSAFYNLKTEIAVKLEYYNPAGSVKDRAAKYMIEDAEKRGLLKKGGVIVEPTSGNTGIAIAAIAAVKGYRVILTMPETMSVERRKILKAYGAEIVLTNGKEGMGGAIKKAEEIRSSIPGAVSLSQFDNPANAKAHFETTGPEIWLGSGGKIDIFVAGVGTGGTITGAGQYLKSKNPAIKVVAVEPSDSPVLSKGMAGPHKIQGLGAGFIPKILDTKIYDEVITAPLGGAVKCGRDIAEKEGIFVGISSGAAIYAAAALAKREENSKKLIVAVLPDSGDKYLSTVLFED